MIVDISNLQTIKGMLHDEWLKQTNPDLCIKICTCIEVIDLLEPNEKGYQIKYDKELQVSKATRKVKQNKVLFN